MAKPLGTLLAREMQSYIKTEGLSYIATVSSADDTSCKVMLDNGLGSLTITFTITRDWHGKTYTDANFDMHTGVGMNPDSPHTNNQLLVQLFYAAQDKAYKLISTYCQPK